MRAGNLLKKIPRCLSRDFFDSVPDVTQIPTLALFSPSFPCGKH